MSSDSAESESSRAFSLMMSASTYQPAAMTATSQVETSGVRNRGWIRAEPARQRGRRAIDSPVRDAGMIVVWVDASAEVATDSRRTQSQPPSTSVPSSREDLLRLVLVLGQEVRPGVGDHGVGHGQVGHQQHDRRDDAAWPGADAESSVSSVRLTADSQPQ